MFDSTAIVFEPQPRSRLLSLPPELRNRIYEYALSERAGKGFDWKSVLKHQPAITKVCRQFRHEALPIWTRDLYIHFGDIKEIGTYAKQVAKTIGALKHFMCFADTHAHKSAAEQWMSMRTQLEEAGCVTAQGVVILYFYDEDDYGIWKELRG